MIWHFVNNFRNAAWHFTSTSARNFRSSSMKKETKTEPLRISALLGIEQRVHTSSNLGMQESSNVHFLNCKVPLWHLTLVSSFLEVQTSSCIFRTTGLLNAEWSTALPDPFTFASLRQLGMLWTLIQFYLDSFDWLEFSDDFNTITGSPHDRSSARKPQWNLDSRRNYPRIFIC